MSYTPTVNIAPTCITTGDGKYSQAGRLVAGTGLALPIVGATFTANRAIAVPIEVPVTVTLAQLFTVNGGVAAGNTDIAIYDSAFVRKISATPTAMSGTATLQFFNVADTVIVAGLYYLAFVTSDATAQVWSFNLADVGLGKAMGCYVQASAGTLPDPFVPSTFLGLYVPLIGFTTRASL